MRQLEVIGVNHRTARVAVRERIALPGGLLARLLETFHAEPHLEEAVVLDTCNRTEVYLVAAPGVEPLTYVLDRISALKRLPPADPDLFYRRGGLEAARHLFRVAASLDSQIVGEHEILGQVRAAYQAAVEARTTRLLLNRLFHCAFRAGKRVMAETDLGRGSAGVGQAAVELAQHIFGDLARKTVLLVGAGTSAERVARALLRAGASHLIVANRTLYRAQDLAQSLPTRPPDEEEAAEGQREVRNAECGMNGTAPAEAPRPPAPDSEPRIPHAGASRPAPSPPGLQAEAIGLEDLGPAVERADLVIASTGAPGTVLRYEDLAAPLGRRSRPLVILDIAVPRDADERLGGLANVFLYNLDDLDRLVAQNLERRRAEIPRAEAVVEDELRAFTRWLASRQVVPTIRLLRRHFGRVRDDEIRQHGAEFELADRQRLGTFSDHLLARILHGPMALLRESAEAAPLSDGLAVADALRRMFDLDSLDEAPAEAEAAPDAAPAEGPEEEAADGPPEGGPP
jgi:glutamyl-tRNA reductase